MQNLSVLFLNMHSQYLLLRLELGESLTFDQLSYEVKVLKERIGIEEEGLQSMQKIAAKVKKFPAAKCIGVLYKVAVTAGYSTSTVESALSALARINLPHRRRMRDHRESDLTHSILT